MIEARLNDLLERHLKPRGWAQSPELGPLDLSGSPCLWLTYGASEVLEQILRPHVRVFEWGCGHSSLWWASRVSRVVSVDHDMKWISRISEKKPDNLTLLHAPIDCASYELSRELKVGLTHILSEQVKSPNDGHNIDHGMECQRFFAYCARITEYPRQYFDIIVIDGMARSACAWLAGQWVRPTGVIVVDNSDRWQYTPGLEALRGMGFGRIDFSGTGPVNSYEWCTSLFVKSILPFLTVPPRRKLETDLKW